MCSPDPTPKNKQSLEKISFGVGTMQLLLRIIRKMCSPSNPQKQQSLKKYSFWSLNNATFVVRNQKDVFPGSNPQKLTKPGKY